MNGKMKEQWKFFDNVTTKRIWKSSICRLVCLMNKVTVKEEANTSLQVSMVEQWSCEILCLLFCRGLAHSKLERTRAQGKTLFVGPGWKRWHCCSVRIALHCSFFGWPQLTLAPSKDSLWRLFCKVITKVSETFFLSHFRFLSAYCDYVANRSVMIDDLFMCLALCPLLLLSVSSDIVFFQLSTLQK